MIEKLFMEDGSLSPKEDLRILLSCNYCFPLICGRWISDELFILLRISPPPHVSRGGNNDIKGKINWQETNENQHPLYFALRLSSRPAAESVGLTYR
jgi:hypothetical protein